MPRQGKLFPEPTVTLKLDRTRGEPRLWIKRLVLWAKPGQVLREIPLRSGLNIIWSPDPGEGAAEVGGQHGSGHGVGKSLFCRLLRYCFGEETFANDDLRARIATAFPDGLVGVEVRISGTVWGVVRPLGIGRRILAGAARPEELLANEARGTGLDPLIEAIRHIIPAEVDEHMPGSGPWRSWLIALAWLARDQECRFGHLMEWRHPSAEARSPAAGLSKEDRFLAVRLLVGAITTREIATLARLDSLAPQRQQLEREAAYLDQAVLRTGRELAKRLNVDTSLLGAGPLGVAGIKSTARDRLGDTEARLGDDENAADLSDLRTRLEQVIRDLAVVRDLEERTRGLIDLQREQMKVLRGERANIDAESITARLGPACPVCNVPIDQALARGCGLSHVLPDTERLTLDQSRVSEQLAVCADVIKSYEAQLREKERLRKGLERQEMTFRDGITRAEARGLVFRKQRRQEWLAAAKTSEDAQRFEVLHGQLATIREQLALLDDNEGELKKELQAHREQHANVISRLDHLFRYVCRALLGSSTEATIALTGQGLRADVQVGGTAMESLKSVAFDVATLMMSVEGRTKLPALLIHDSPREADLGISHYHRLFRLMASLEELGDPAPFQYIVTTTTDPPQEMIGREAVVLTLYGTEPGERLLRVDL